MNTTKKYTLLLTITLLMATAYMAVPTEAQAVTEWPQFMNNAANTGYSTCDLPETFMIGWKFETGGMIRSSPAVVGGRVYIGSDDDYLYCVNVDTGAEIWKYQTGGPIYSSPAVVGGTVFFGSADDYVYALDANSGSLKWSFKTGGYIVASPTVEYGHCYIGSSDGVLYAINVNDGSLTWSYATDGPILHSAAAAVDGYVYSASMDQYMRKFVATNGTLVWGTHCVEGQGAYGFGFSSVMYALGKIYCAADDRGLYCLDAETGAIDWWQRLSEGFANTYVSSTPSFDGEKVYCTSPYKLYAWNPLSPQTPVIDEVVAGNMIFTSPVVADGKTFAGSRDLYWYMIDTSTGQRIQSFRDAYSSPWSGTAALVDGKIIVGNYNNWLYCFVQGTQTALSRWASPTTVMLGDPVDFGGGITPAVSGATVTIIYTRPDLTTVTSTVTTETDGTYADSYTPDMTGVWTMHSTWPGSTTHGQAESRRVRFTVDPVTPMITSLSRWANPTMLTLGDPVNFGGGILPAVSGATVTLTFTKPDATTTTATATTDSNGVYAYSFEPDMAGIWSFTASWPGDATYKGKTTPGFVFSVRPEGVENGAEAEAGIPTEYIYAIVAVIAIAIVAIVAFWYMRRK